MHPIIHTSTRNTYITMYPIRRALTRSGRTLLVFYIYHQLQKYTRERSRFTSIDVFGVCESMICAPVYMC